MKKGILILLAMVLAFSTITQSVANAAGSQSTNVNVSTTAINVCTIIVSGHMTFSNYPIGGDAPIDSTGSVNVNCTGTGYDVLVGRGLDPDITRRMADDSSNYLNYEIYADSGRTNVWADNTSGGVNTYQSGAAGALTHYLYGRIFEGQDVPLGTYSDTVAVTVAW